MLSLMTFAAVKTPAATAARPTTTPPVVPRSPAKEALATSVLSAASSAEAAYLPMCFAVLVVARDMLNRLGAIFDSPLARVVAPPEALQKNSISFCPKPATLEIPFAVGESAAPKSNILATASLTGAGSSENHFARSLTMFASSLTVGAKDSPREAPACLIASHACRSAVLVVAYRFSASMTMAVFSDHA